MIKLRVKEVLEREDKSIYWLAENTELTYTALHRLVNGETEGIQFSTLDEIMGALEIDDFNEIFEKN